MDTCTLYSVIVVCDYLVKRTALLNKNMSDLTLHRAKRLLLNLKTQCRDGNLPMFSTLCVLTKRPWFDSQHLFKKNVLCILVMDEIHPVL